MRVLRLWIVLSALVAGAPLLRAQAAPVVVGGGGGAPGAGHVTKSADRPQGVSSPVPSLLLDGRKVFLSNGGAEAGLFPHPFTGTQDRAYGFAYKMLTDSKRFLLVGTPAEADLVMELTLSAPTGSLGGDKQHGTEDALPVFKIIVYDRPTHYVLWTMSQTIDKANLQKTHDKNFDDSLTLLLNQLTAAASASEPTK